MASDMSDKKQQTSSLDSSFPVLLPQQSALHLVDDEFLDHVKGSLRRSQVDKPLTINLKEPTKADTEDADASQGSRFVDALKTAVVEPKSNEPESFKADNKMFTENRAVANRSTTSPLLDLFVELERTVDPQRLEKLLSQAWQEDSLATLKIIFNARSIHLGKGEQDSFYRCFGWLREHHPITVVFNLEWLHRSVIETKSKPQDPDEMVIVEEEDAEAADGPDIKYGGSHGYWKDMLNLLVLAVQNELKVRGDVRGVLHKPNVQKKPHKRRKLQPDMTTKEAPTSASEHKQLAKDRRHELESERHAIAEKRMGDPFYRCLHLHVARLFAAQLVKDKALLLKDTVSARRLISLAAKWAPSLEGFHDKHTLIASTIAELLSPTSAFNGTESREMYIKHAREAYRKEYLAPLRKALAVVERDITAESFNHINYAKVPSIAMNNYSGLFAKKDFEHFEKYIEKVAQGKAKISGAVLLPGLLIHQVREQYNTVMHTAGRSQTSAQPGMSVKKLKEAKIAESEGKVIDQQWNTMVQRIKDNGKRSSAIAVCDVSGSMTYPSFPDKSAPIDTAIGLSLLLAEITAAPFGGHFITFSERPEMQSVDLAASLRDKYVTLSKSRWSMNTDFNAVFERLILPAAQKHQLAAADMVQTVFVFSDMQFDAAQSSYYQAGSSAEKWETNYERIKRKFQTAGYELPHLVFWNLAGGRDGDDATTAPKPVTKDDIGCTLVSGYSQAMLKMFLDEGTFVEEGEEEMEEVRVAEDGSVKTRTVKKQQEKNPMDGLWKAIGHKSYDVLKVYD